MVVFGHQLMETCHFLQLFQSEMHQVQLDCQKSLSSVYLCADSESVYEERIEEIKNKEEDDDAFLPPPSPLSEEDSLSDFEETRSLRVVEEQKKEVMPRPKKKPKSGSDQDKKKRPNHCPRVIQTLKDWLHQHKMHPVSVSNSHKKYPSESQKKELCFSTGLSLVQLNNWFINARRRYISQK